MHLFKQLAAGLSCPMRMSAGSEAQGTWMGYKIWPGPRTNLTHLRCGRGVWDVVLQAPRVGDGVVQDDGVPDADVLQPGGAGQQLGGAG